MKLRNIILPAVLAMAGLALSTPSSKGAAGDLYLGVYNTSTSTFDYLVDIGSYTNFTGNGAGVNSGQAYTGSTITLNTDAFKAIGTAANVTTDLNKAVGSGWFSSSSVLFGVIGVQGNGTTNTIYVSDPNATSTTASWAPQDSTTQGTAAGDITNMASNYASHLGGNGKVSNGSIQSGNLSGSYYDYSPAGTIAGGSSFEIYAGDIGTSSRTFYLVEQVATDAAANGLAAGSAPVLGKFTVGNDGTITYAAVPEPSTYAMIVIAAAFFVVWRMKRSSGSMPSSALAA